MRDICQVKKSHLINLIKNAKNPEIQTLQQLYRILFGGKRCTWNLFEHLLYWLLYSVRHDGSIYKSARELAVSLSCCVKSIDRAIPALEAIGFEVKIQKANGAPTRHFKLDEEQFVTKMAEVFGYSFDETLILMELELVSDISNKRNTDKRPDETQTNDQNHSGKMSDSITRTTNNKNNTREHQSYSYMDQVIQIRRWCAVLDTQPQTIDHWVKEYGFDMVASTIREGLEKQQQGKIRRSIFGWTRATLKAKHLNSYYKAL